MGLLNFFKPQPEQKHYMEGWEDGYDQGWESAAQEFVQYLRDIGKGALANELKEEFLNGE